MTAFSSLADAPVSGKSFAYLARAAPARRAQAAGIEAVARSFFDRRDEQRRHLELAGSAARARTLVLPDYAHSPAPDGLQARIMNQPTVWFWRAWRFQTFREDARVAASVPDATMCPMPHKKDSRW
jgi:hypothetical protein